MLSSLFLGWRPALRRGAPVLFGIAGLLAAVWAVRLNVSASRPFVQPASTSPQQREEISATRNFDLPDFQADDMTVSVSRQIELFTHIPQRARVEVLRYTVQQGDSIFGIAGKFGLEPETILWGNYEVLNDDPHMLRPGQELNILPMDGTYYQWQAGDSITAVADFFGVESQEILEWPGNALNPLEPEIEVGQWLVVPNGRRALRQWFVPTIARGSAGVGSAFGPGGCVGDYTGGAVGTGGFIWPAPNHYVSGNDYWSGHLAIDIAAGTGTGIWAADSGVVVFAGWSTVGYGYMVMLDHGNGWQSLYAHLSQVDVACGQSVGQGQRIGLAGSTGNSTGPHLHFETRFEGGFVNPWYVLP